jgi:hypothetical protein
MRMVDGWQVRIVLASVLLALAAFGCDGDDGGAGGGGGSQPAANCPERCATRAIECGAPAALVDQLCADVCDENPTEDQARCLEAEDCDVLQQSFFGGAAPCGIGKDDGDDGADDGGSDDGADDGGGGDGGSDDGAGDGAGDGV